MAREQLKTLTEPMYYLLLALIRPQHGYGVMQRITEMTENRVQVGAGTLYALLARFEGEGIITQVMEKDRKKIYQITPKGAEVLTEEFCRLNRLVEDGRRFFDSTGTLLPITYETAPQEAEQVQAQSAETGQAQDGREEAPGKEEQQTEDKDGKEKQERKGMRGGFRKGIFAT